MAMQRKTYSDCQGCSLCILPCPMWQQHRDVMFSPQGIAKAMLSGAKAQDLSEQLASCIQCGACDVMCPEEIDLTAMIAQGISDLALDKPRGALEAEKLSPFVMSCDAKVQAQITCHDLYIIDAEPFHADYARRVEHYTSLRAKTGCRMNLDLNRMAIGTGIGSVAAESGTFDVDQHMKHMFRGLDFTRVVVESEADQHKLLQASDKPVVSIAELFYQ